jgi:thiamine monophosphate kinase
MGKKMKRETVELDIVERLRDCALQTFTQGGKEFQLTFCDEAADEIERLRKALQHISELNPLCIGGIKVAIDAARAALKGDE